MKSLRLLAIGLGLACLGLGPLLHGQNATVIPPAKAQYLDANGRPLSGGKVYSYVAGTTTPLATYSDSTAGAANANPVILDAGGFANIWLLNSASYKIVVQDSTGVPQYTVDNINNPGALLAVQKGAANGLATLDSTSHLPASQLTLYSQGGAGAASRTITSKLQESVSMEDFSGSDCGAKINAAYAALPAAGGSISIHTACSFSTAIVFGTANKTVILSGAGNSTALTYTGTGTALTINNGITFDFSTSIRDIVLTGPGNATAAVGVLIGGTNGAVGWSVEHVIIQGFGTGFKTSNNHWVGSVSQSMIRDSGINVLMPSGATNAGENIQFNHVVFADAPPPYTNSVWIQQGEVEFTDCSFDSAQVHIGNASTSSVKATIIGAHFENPNYVWNATNYDMLVEDAHAANSLAIISSHVEQDAPTGGPSQFFRFAGGKVHIEGLSSYSPGGSPLTNLAILSGAVNIDVYNYNDMAGNITGSLLGGSTTGFVVNFSGANTGSSVARNFVMKAGDAVGGAALDVTGNIKASGGGQLVSTATTGTQPFLAGSTTPVTNLFAQPVTYTAAGTQQTGTVHLVYGTVGLSGGAATITLSGAAVYQNSSSYVCTAADTTSTAAVKVAPASGSSFALAGSGSDNVAYSCVGN